MPDSNPGLMTIFTEALERTDPADRAAYLDRACGGDADLRKRVEDLLAAHPAMGRFLEPERTSHHESGGIEACNPGAETGSHDPDGSTGSFDQGTSVPARRFDTPIGTSIGRYTLVEVIGEGGMGSVYLASQTEPVKRQVALKLIKSGMDSKAVLARFDAERQALALMDHPNIARVFDGGTTDRGQPFFVMELVRGLPITDYCDQKRLPVPARLELFVQVCRAVQHAHQKGIIHRDLKPGNVLVTEVDGRPTPKVIDFGVAKATEVKLTDMSYADTGAIVGTPAYMSPEQADPSQADIDTRTDVYALGVILYELLTGSPPIDSKQFKRGAVLEMLRMVREVDPPRPSTKLSGQEALPNIAANRSIEPAKLAKALRGELDWVVMKALEKDRNRRYDTADGFARDIQRYLADEVVEARPPSAGYRLKKFIRRHKGQVLAASLILVALLCGIAGTTLGLLRAESRRGEAVRAQEAEAERVKERDVALGKEQVALKAEAERSDELRHRLGVSAAIISAAAIDSRDAPLAAERLERVPPEQRGFEWRYLKQLASGGLFTLPGLRQGMWQAEVTAVAHSPDGERIVVAYRGANYDGSVRVWDARTGVPVADLPDFKDAVMSLAFSADGTRLVVLECNPYPLDPSATTIKIWDAKSWKLIRELKTGEIVTCFALASDGKRLVTGGSRLKIRDLATGETLKEFEVGKAPPMNGLSGVAISPDGKRIAACEPSGNLRIWDAEKGEAPLLTPAIPALQVQKGTSMMTLAFSPDGGRLLACQTDGLARVLNPATGVTLFEIKARLRPPIRDIIRMFLVYPAIAAFSPDGSRIVLAGGDYCMHEATIWDARTGTELLTLSGHTGTVRCAAFSPDGLRVVTGSDDGTAKVWDAAFGSPRLVVGGERAVSGVAFSPVDDRMAVTGTRTILNLRTGAAVAELKGLVSPAKCVEFSPDGTRLVTAGGEREFPGKATMWDAATGAALFHLQGLRDSVNDVAFSPDGNRILTAGARNSRAIELKLWDARTGGLLHDLSIDRSSGLSVIGESGGSVAFSPDGSQFAAGDVLKGETIVWDAKTLERKFSLRYSQHPVRFVAYSPDSTKILTGTDKTVFIWDSRTGARLTLELQGHTDTVTNAAFSPDGKRIVSGGDRTVRIWDARTGTSLLELRTNAAVLGATFNRDGTRLVGVLENGVAMVWEAPETDPTPVLRGHRGLITRATFNPAGDRVITSSLDETVKVWDARTGALVHDWKNFDGPVGQAAFSADGSRIAMQERIANGTNGEIRWHVRDARTGEVIHGEAVPPKLFDEVISADGRFFARVDVLQVELMALKPGEEELVRRRGWTQSNDRRHRDAFNAARQAKDEFAARFHLYRLPENERPLREAQFAADLGKRADAIAWYRKAAERDTKDGDLQVALGHLLLQEGRRADAIVCFHKAIEWEERFVRLGEKLPDPGAAIACFRKATEVHPARVDLHRRLARLLKMNGRLEEAIAAYRPIMALEPKNAQFHSEMGDYLWDLGKRDEAFASYRTACELDAGGERSLRLAVLQSWFGRDKELAETQRRASKFVREGTNPRRGALECYISPAADPKESQETLAAMRELVKASKNPYLWQRLTIGMGEHRTGDYAAAIETLRSAVAARDPNDGFRHLPPIANCHRAMALFRLGKKDEAKDLLAQIAAAMRPIPKDELLTSEITQNAQQLLVWLSFKEAKSLIGFDATPPSGKK